VITEEVLKRLLKERTNEVIVFSGITFTTPIELLSLENHQNTIQFKNCEFKNDFLISDSSIGACQFEQCQFNTINLKNLEIASSIVFSGFVANKINLLSITGTNTTIALQGHAKEYNIHNLNCYLIYTGFFVDDENEHFHRKVDRICIGGDNHDTKIQLHQRGSTYNNHTVSSQIGELLITSSQANIDISDGHIEKLSLHQTLTSGKVYVRTMTIEKLLISDFLCQGVLHFENVQLKGKDPEVRLVHSQLGESRFSHCDFSIDDKFYYFSSDLSSIVSHETIWPKEVQVAENKLDRIERLKDGTMKAQFSETEKASEAKQKSSFYRQIKNISLSDNNRREATLYNALELNSTIKSNELSMQDRLVLWISKISSNHGTYWVRPLILLVTFSFFWSYCLTLSTTDCFNSYEISDAIILLNPAHRHSELSVYGYVESLFSFHLIDTVSRISSSYFIYQAIRASRRFT
jgi:hypothetical protein